VYSYALCSGAQASLLHPRNGGAVNGTDIAAAPVACTDITAAPTACTDATAPMNAADIVLPVFVSARVRSWPRHEVGGRGRPTLLGIALTDVYNVDAHCTQYECPNVERRLSWLTIDTPEAMEVIGGSINMMTIMFDVDHAPSHAAGGSGANLTIDEWWALEIAKVMPLNTFVYRSRGGYRIVYTLPAPFSIKTRADAEAWTDFYLCSVAYLRRVHGIVADPTADWQRMFRLPHARRIDLGKKGETVEEQTARELRNAAIAADNYATIGDPNQIGVWS
jgi:hypothetical protein